MYSAHRLLHYLALFSSHCNLIPSSIRHCQAYSAEASPCIAFMLANLIVLAILITSNKPPKAPHRRRQSSPSLTPESGKPPKQYSMPQHYEARSIAASKSNSGALIVAEIPKETLTSAPSDTNPLPNKSEEAEGCPKRLVGKICIGDGGLQHAAATVNPRETLILISGLAGGRERDLSEEAGQITANDDLDKRCAHFINTFFARVRAEAKATST